MFGEQTFAQLRTGFRIKLVSHTHFNTAVTVLG